MGTNTEGDVIGGTRNGNRGQRVLDNEGTKGGGEGVIQVISKG